MHRKPTGGINKHGKHTIARNGKGKKVCTKQPAPSQVVTSKQGFMGVECNHTTTNPLRASSLAKPRTREAITSIKHRSKQA